MQTQRTQVQPRLTTTTHGPAGASTQTAAHLSANAPSAATDGSPLNQQFAIRVQLSADSTRTFSGTGSVRFWFYDEAVSRWRLNNDLSVDVTVSGVRDIILADLEVPFGASRVYAEAYNLAVSAGAITVTVVTAG